MTISRTLLCVVLISVSWVAEKRTPTFAQTTPLAARKFDEFGDIQNSDLIARLDNFAIQLQNEPTSKGFILVYRTRRDLPGLNNRLAFRSKDYLVNSRAVSSDRMVTVDGGEADCQTQELWIVPPGTAPTPRGDAYQRYFPDLDSPRKIDEYGFEVPARSSRARHEPRDASDAEYLETFATQLRKEPRTTACIIVYAQYNPRPGLVDYYGNYEPIRDRRLDPPGTARKRLSIEKRLLIRLYGIRANRITTINGGYRKRRMVELWIVPRGEHTPIPTSNSFPAKRAQGRR
jgi:hypothetical protein